MLVGAASATVYLEERFPVNFNRPGECKRQWKDSKVVNNTLLCSEGNLSSDQSEDYGLYAAWKDAEHAISHRLAFPLS